jgi:uncharacterized membrane protein
MRRLPDVPSILLAVLSVLYPVLAVIGVRAFGAGAVIGLLVLSLLVRTLFPSARKISILLTAAPLAVAFALACIAAVNSELSVRLYPAFMNLAMLAAFASTLWKPPSMIESFARLSEPDLPESGVRYTRTVTMVWVGFFVINGSLALWTALYGSWRVWTLYNGVIAYLAMGVLLGGEYLVRQHFRARYAS